MNLREVIASGHSKAICRKVEKYVGDRGDRFAELMKIFLEDDYRLSQRAVWPLGNLCVSYPHHMQPFYRQLADRMKDATAHPAVPRNILRIFALAGVPKEIEGEVLDHCLAVIPSAQWPIAVRAHAISVADALCTKYPEARHELALILSHLGAQPLAPALRSRVRHALAVKARTR